MLKPILGFGLTRRPIVVLAMLVFIGAGLFAFTRLNIEAYPNPAPVILEITAQAPGVSAEEMEKYYTIPIEIALYATPGVVNIRSTSFYGLSFVRVTFRYGTDYYTAYGQAAIALQQGVNLPGTQVPQIQQSSLVGEIIRYQITGPQHFGLTNLRTVQDWIVTRRLLAVPGVVQINSWGGTTKQFNVDVDPHKLEAYGVTVAQIVTALGNANNNVGGREINIGHRNGNRRRVEHAALIVKNPGITNRTFFRPYTIFFHFQKPFVDSLVCCDNSMGLFTSIRRRERLDRHDRREIGHDQSLADAVHIEIELRIYPLELFVAFRELEFFILRILSAAPRPGRLAGTNS